jgi:hypothetical protein
VERSGGDHHLIGRVVAVLDLDVVPILGPPDRPDAAAQLNRQGEVPGIRSEVGRHVVAAGVAVRIAREGQAWQAAVASRGKQLQRVPPGAPGGRRVLSRFENRELATLPSEEVPDSKTRLAAADNDHVAIGAAVVDC